jgi:hypothetical protein
MYYSYKKRAENGLASRAQRQMGLSPSQGWMILAMLDGFDTQAVALVASVVAMTALARRLHGGVASPRAEKLACGLQEPLPIRRNKIKLGLLPDSIRALLSK